MRHTKLIPNDGKMSKTIPVRMTPSLAKEISDFAREYKVSQQDTIRLAICKGLHVMREFYNPEREEKEAGDEQK